MIIYENNQLGMKISYSAMYDLATLRNSLWRVIYVTLLNLDYRKYILKSIRNILTNLNTVDSRYLEIKGALKNTSTYQYFDISDL